KVVLAAQGEASVSEALAHARRGEGAALLFYSRDAHDAVGRAATERESSPDLVRLVPMPDDPDGYARALYASFHDLDAAKVEVVVVERPPATEAWWAISDRLRRAAR